MDYLSMIQGGESATLEFKERDILFNSEKFCSVITGMANTNGGYVLIGVRDDGKLEEITYNKDDEEKIMNIIFDKCQPRLNIEFESVNIINDKYIYVLKIPKMGGIPYAVKSGKKGLNYYIRHGTETRIMPFNELERLFKGDNYDITKGIEIPINRGNTILVALGDLIISYFTKLQKSELTNYKIILRSIGIISLTIIALPLLIYSINKTQLYIDFYTNNTWLIITSFFAFSISTSFLKLISLTKCPNCKSNFSYKLNKKWVFNKRNIDDDYEEWTVRTLKTCKTCNYYEYSNPQLETIKIIDYYSS